MLLLKEESLESRSVYCGPKGLITTEPSEERLLNNQALSP